MTITTGSAVTVIYFNTGLFKMAIQLGTVVSSANNTFMIFKSKRKQSNMP